MDFEFFITGGLSQEWIIQRTQILKGLWNFFYFLEIFLLIIVVSNIRLYRTLIFDEINRISCDL